MTLQTLSGILKQDTPEEKSSSRWTRTITPHGKSQHWNFKLYTVCLESKENSMNQVISSRSTSSTDQFGAGGSLKRSILTGHRMTVSRVIGALFLCGFLLYGVGSVLVTSVT